MKFAFTKEWIESVLLAEDSQDPSAGKIAYDPAELASSKILPGAAEPITPSPSRRTPRSAKSPRT